MRHPAEIAGSVNRTFPHFRGRRLGHLADVSEKSVYEDKSGLNECIGLMSPTFGYHPQNSHSATSFKRRTSIARSSGVVFCRTLSSAVSRASISRSRYFRPLAVKWIRIALPDS